jgi:hypothetical protein
MVGHSHNMSDDFCWSSVGRFQSGLKQNGVKKDVGLSESVNADVK